MAQNVHAEGPESVMRLINPLVDIVFKTLFATEANKPLLLDFLNSVLQWKSPIVEVELLNPYSSPEQLDAKLTIVDIRAKDSQGRQFQVEVQVRLHAALEERMVYTWAGIYREQLVTGENYSELQPVISIWILDHRLFADRLHHHRFEMRDQQGRLLTDHCAIHVLELPKWKQEKEVLAEEERWVYFLKGARKWRTLPLPLREYPIMEKAMETLQRFGMSEREYLDYQTRMQARMLERTYIREVERRKEQVERLAREVEEKQREIEEKTRELEERKREAEEKNREVEERKREAAEKAREVDQKEKEAQEARRAALRKDQEIEASKKELEEAHLQVERAEQERRAAEAKERRLRARLLAAGLDPDTP